MNRPPGVAPDASLYRYEIRVEWPTSLAGLSAAGVRGESGTLWLPPGCDPDGVRDYVAGQMEPPEGFSGTGEITAWHLTPGQ